MESGTEAPSPVRVFVVDDHELVRRGVADILAEEGLELAGQASTAAEGLDGVLAARPGGALLDPSVTRSILDRLQGGPTHPARTLSERERRLLGLIGEGLTNREIAGRLFLSERTVRNYVSRLLAKLGVRRRAQAAAYAAKHPEIAP